VPFTLPEKGRARAARIGRRLPAPLYHRLRPIYGRLAGAPTPPLAVPAPAPSLVIPPRRALGPEPDFVELPPRSASPLEVWPKPPPTGFLGQLDTDFQSSLAAQWADVDLDDCLFYHRARLLDGRVIEGSWNLLDGESEYLGHIPLSGRRVLELGPATGWLTTWMEQQGAAVVGFDVGWDLSQDLIPLPGLDLERLRPDYIARACLVQNSWWYLHRDHGLRAQAAYGSIYDLPADLGRFDTAVFGSILLHLRDPFRALEQAAHHTDDTMVVVEPLIAELVDLGPVARWNPTGAVNPTGWWHHSPDVIVDMLSVLGFGRATVSYHQHPYRDEDVAGRYVDGANFTVVARR